MIQPTNQDDAFLADVRDRILAANHGVALWWLGQAGFLLKSGNRYMLLDPYLSDSLTRKYVGTETPHHRMTEIVVAPSRLDFIDVITSSHNHTDHLDGETIRAVIDANEQARASSPQIVVAEAGRQQAAQRLGVEPGQLVGMDDGQTKSVAGFEIHAIPAAHETLETDDQGHHRFLGYVIKAGRYTIYHAGDTVRYEGMVERLRSMNVDVALLPINGRGVGHGVAGNLCGPEAAILAERIGAKLAIPCHYDMFDFNTASPAGFIAICRQLGQSYRVLKCGERFVPSA